MYYGTKRFTHEPFPGKPDPINIRFRPDGSPAYFEMDGANHVGLSGKGLHWNLSAPTSSDQVQCVCLVFGGRSMYFITVSLTSLKKMDSSPCPILRRLSLSVSITGRAEIRLSIPEVREKGFRIEWGNASPLNSPDNKSQLAI
jgi:hypothetical protein